MRPAWLADERCTKCGGQGRPIAKIRSIRDAERPCNCVYRRASRMVIGRLREIAARGPHWNFHVWARDAEYSADVWLIAKRELTDKQRIIFADFLVAGREWRDVDQKTRLGRGQFFHEVYRTEQTLGRALLASPCFPPKAYFSGIYNAEGGVSCIYQMFSGEIDVKRRLFSRSHAAAA